MRITLMVLAAMTLFPMSASALTDAACLALYDSVGTRVGRVQDNNFTSSVHFIDGARLAAVEFARTQIFSSGGVYFTGPNCSGDSFFETGSLSVLVLAQVVDNEVTYPDLSAADVSVTVASVQNSSGLCQSNVRTLSAAVPAYTFTLPTFTPPFHLEAEDCMSMMMTAAPPMELMSLVALFACGAIWRMRRA